MSIKGSIETAISLLERDIVQTNLFRIRMGVLGQSDVQRSISILKDVVEHIKDKKRDNLRGKK